MMCNGQYVVDHPCYPLCPSPDGWGCDYSSVFGGGSSGGPTDSYTVTTGDPVAGNTQTRTHTTMIDPYQSITPSQLGFDGSNRENGTATDGTPSNLWFNQTGIDVGGKNYQYWPIFTFDPGNSGFPDSDDLGGWNDNSNPRLRVSAIRTVNGVWG